MSLLINDMLSLSNADNHSWKMHPVFCELDTLLLDTYEKYEPLMQDHHMKFFIELPEEEIPPCPCDPERISQVLGILPVSYTHLDVYKRQALTLYVRMILSTESR